MNFHIAGHNDWAIAPPLFGQREYSLMLPRKFASKGVTSPPAQIGYSYGVSKQPA